MKKIVYIVLISIAVLSVFLLANKKNENNEILNKLNNYKQETNLPNTTSMANPASEFCVKAGGSLVKVNNPQGEQNNCVFKNGENCDEWALFRGECDISDVSNTAKYSEGNKVITVIYRIFNGTIILNAPSLNLDNIELSLAISASGARYLSKDEKIEFWEHQNEATVSVNDKKVFRGLIMENTETYEGVASGKKIVFEQQNYTSYKLTVGTVVTKGELNTERGWKTDEDATVYVLDWKKPESEQKIFVRKTNTKTLVELNQKREEVVPKVVLTIK